MFYQTQLTAIGGSEAVDVHGKKLHFVGNLPARVGDSVWTDGKFIFGHVPIRGETIIPVNQSKIPVLADDFCGYIEQGGSLTSYPIVNGDWIVNDEEYISSGDNTFNGHAIIDAVICDNDSVLFATDGFFRENQRKTYKNRIGVSRILCANGTYALREWASREPPFRPYASNTPWFVEYRTELQDGSELSFGVDKLNNSDPSVDDSDQHLRFFKDATPVADFSLKPFADTAAELAWTMEPKIMAKSSTDTTDVFLVQYSPPDSFIASKYARIVAMHIDKNGDWDAVISASAYGYCFPYIVFNVSLFLHTFPNDEDKVYSDELADAVYYVGNTIQNNYFPLNVERHPRFMYDSEWSDALFMSEFKKDVLDAAAYYIPRVRFKEKSWYPNIFNSFIVSRVHNGEVVDVIFSKVGGGNLLPLTGAEWNERRRSGRVEYRNFVVDSQITKKQWTFPLDDHFSFRADGLDIKSIFETDDKNGEHTIFDVDRQMRHALHGKLSFSECIFNFPSDIGVSDNYVDPKAVILSEQEAAKPDDVIGYFPFYVHLDYIVNCLGTEVNIFDNPFAQDENVYLDAWYRNTQPFNESVGLQYMFAKLNADSYLLGIRNGNLLKINSNGDFNVVLTNLKNFRLCKMKNIRHARANAFSERNY